MVDLVAGAVVAIDDEGTSTKFPAPPLPILTPLVVEPTMGTATGCAGPSAGSVSGSSSASGCDFCASRSYGWLS